MDGTDSNIGPMKEADVLRIELDVLRTEHRQLDGKIRLLEESPSADMLQIRRLKREKLRLKDLIAQIEDRLFPDIIA